MAELSLTIQPDKARLTVTGKSWDDIPTDSGPGDTIEQITIGDIEELIDIDLPDIPEDVDIIIGDLPEYEDPVIIIDWPEGPEIIELPGLDLDDLDLDWEMDLDIALDIDGLDTLAFVDLDLNIQMDDLPDEIRVVHMPYKMLYNNMEVIDFDGLQVQAYCNGEVWEPQEGTKYWHGYIPIHEMLLSPHYAIADISADEQDVDLGLVNFAYYSYGPWGNRYWPNIAVWNAYGPLRVHFSGIDAQTGSPITLQWNEEHQLYVGNIDINGSSPSPSYGPATLNYLTVIPYAAGGGTTSRAINIWWQRPGDRKMLQTTFNVSVKQNGRSGGNGGR